jgi:hypothetical protein
MARQKRYSKTQEHVSDRPTLSGETGDELGQDHGPPASPGKPNLTQNIEWSDVANVLDQIKNYTVETLTNVTAHSLQIEKRLDRIEKWQAEISDVMKNGRDEDRTHYTPAEFAKLLVKDGDSREVRTVRKWCKEGRIKAGKRPTGRGRHKDWTIPHDEYVRYKNEGLRDPED